jgi:hypothetical protein
MLVTAPIQFLVDNHMRVGFVVIALFLAVLVLATYALAYRLGGPLPDLLTACVVGNDDGAQKEPQSGLLPPQPEPLPQT